jgi:hypothetical protein
VPLAPFAADGNLKVCLFGNSEISLREDRTGSEPEMETGNQCSGFEIIKLTDPDP